jgi:hypothetical protein
MNCLCMNRAVLLVAVIAASGCHRQANPVAELEKTATMLKDAPPTATPEGKAEAAPATQVQEAITEFKAGKMEDAVTRLQALRMQTTMTPEQRMALQDSVAAVMTEIYTLAEKGDARAIAAVQAYERIQNRQ